MQDRKEPARLRAARRWEEGRQRPAASRRGSETGGARRRVMGGLAAVSAAALLAVPVALAAAPPQPLPTQRIDMKVLLVGNAGDGVYDAWKAQLERTGVPYASVATNATLTDAFLADYAGNHAKFQAVITAQDPPAAMQTALAKLEETFGIRQISDNTAGAAHGLTNPTAAQAGEQGGTTAQLTAAGKAAFPYLKGPVPLPPDSTTDVDVFGYQSTPLPGANFTTLLTGANNSSYLGVNVRVNGTEEMVNTVPGNQFQSHHQLLRDGMLNWVTRGVYLGYSRNYLGLDIDDIFLPDDKWDAVNNVTDYNATLQMDAQDVEDAITWQRRTGLKLNMVYNMSGITQAGGNALLQAFKANSPATGQPRKNAFRWINHTFSHPNLDCTTAAFTTQQITLNQAQFNANLAPVAAGLNDPSELVTGEHSGLANLIPGNPGTIDPPFFVDTAVGAAGTGAFAAAGSYEYGVTATTAGGETPASFVTVDVAAAGSARVSWESVCKATSYKLYRHPAGTTGGWELIHTTAGTTPAFNDNGAAVVSFTDTGAAGTPDADGPPIGNSALKAAHGQNPFLDDALVSGGIRTIASDTSKPYPNPSDSATVDAGAASNHTPGSTFPVGPAQTVPRYPTNLYYNVANRADQLDEYNFIYTPDDPATPAIEGGCVNSATNTCRTTPATWTDYMESEVGIMLGHVYGNDPRPHYFHQTNIAQYDPNAADTNTATGGTLYAVVNTLLNRYEASIDRAKAPLVQISQDEAARTLLRQNAWKAARAGVTAYIQDGKVHISAPAGTNVPVTGTTTGSDYASTRSGWTTVDGGELVLSPQDPRTATAPSIAGTVGAGATLTANAGTWTGTGTIATSFQWQKSAAGSDAWANIAGATGATYTVPAADETARFRVVVSAGNWISSVSQAASAAVAKPAPVTPPPGDKPPTGNPPKDNPPTGNPPTTDPPKTDTLKPARPRLSRVKLAPRKFAVARAKASGKARKTGTTVSWTLDRAATVRLTVQRAGKGNRWRTVGTLSRKARQGTGTLRFSGRVSGKALATGRYRLVVVATADSLSSSTKTVGFKVLRA